MTYSEKLRDPRWQKKRLEILERDAWACDLCWDTQSTLNIHHKKYTGDPWDAPDEDLQTLCERCHKNIKWLTQFKGRHIYKNPEHYIIHIESGFLFISDSGVKLVFIQNEQLCALHKSCKLDHSSEFIDL